MDNKLILKVTDLSVKLNDKQILNNINLELHQGKVVTIIGPNGGGKTTLIKSILNLIKPSSGKIWLKSKIRFGYAPQKINLNPILPITVSYFLNLNRKNISNNFIKKIIKDTHIEAILDSPLQNISGGELQMVLLARALLNKPDLLILDEPTQGVDIKGQLRFYSIINQLRQEKKISIIIVSHDLFMVMKNTDYVFCLNQHICCEGNPTFINQQEDFHKLFGKDALQGFSVYEHHHNQHCEHL